MSYNSVHGVDQANQLAAGKLSICWGQGKGREGEGRGVAFWLFTFRPLSGLPSRALLSHFRSAFWKFKTPTGRCFCFFVLQLILILIFPPTPFPSYCSFSTVRTWAIGLSSFIRTYSVSKAK